MKDLSNEELVALADSCFFTQGNRKSQVNKWRCFYYQGKEDGLADVNRVYGEINNVLSLIFSPEHIILEGIRLDSHIGEDDTEQDLLDEIKDTVKSNFFGNRLDIKMFAIVLGALIDGNAIVKPHWSNTTQSVKLVHYPPELFGVCFEGLNLNDEAQIFATKTDLTEEQVKVYYPDVWKKIKDAAAGEGEEGKFEQSGALHVLLGGQGSTDAEIQVDKEYDFRPKSALKVYEQRELYQFELADEQWRRTVIIEDQVVAGKDELTGRKNHDFFNICPLPVPGNFWGLSTVYLLHMIQLRRNELIDQIRYTVERLVDPSMVITGYNVGAETAEAEAEKLKTPGGLAVFDGQGGKAEPFTPKLELEKAFEFEQFYDLQQKFITGINEIMQGQAQKNVRSGQYASMLAQFASTELKREAHTIEAQMEEIFTATGMLYQVNDGQQHKRNGRNFLLAQYSHPYRIEIYAHTGSPITTEYNLQIIMGLVKELKGFPLDVLVEVLPVPYKNKILKSLKEQAQKEEQRQAKLDKQEAEKQQKKEGMINGKDGSGE